MGYTTDFTGRFEVSRPVDKEAHAFLVAIKDCPEEAGVFADWLEDKGDPRATAVRTAQGPQEVWDVFHALSPSHAAYLAQFAGTRRMKRDAKKCRALPDPIREAVGLDVGEEGGYFVGGEGYCGQGNDPSVVSHGRVPAGQPSLWCQWVPSEDRRAIEWDNGEKFYSYTEWLEYLIEHFLGPWGYLLNGEVNWQGEDEDDTGTIVVQDNVVTER